MDEERITDEEIEDWELWLAGKTSSPHVRGKRQFYQFKPDAQPAELKTINHVELVAMVGADRFTSNIDAPGARLMWYFPCFGEYDGLLLTANLEGYVGTHGKGLVWDDTDRCLTVGDQGILRAAVHRYLARGS